VKEVLEQGFELLKMGREKDENPLRRSIVGVFMDWRRAANYILCAKRSATSPKSVWKSVARVSALRLGELNPLVWYSLDSRESSSPELMNG
jgi:hypothetical protein